MQYTQQQQAALRQRATSVVLSAGAGCGKTFVLTERFLAQLDPTGQGPREDALSRLVAITFTQRAAREMRQRIRHHCHRRAEQASDPLVRRRWQRLLHQLHTARVSTIDSFCVALLRRWAVEAGLDPEFHVLDEFQARVLRHQVAEEVLQQLLAEQDEALMFVARAEGLFRLRSVLEQMLDKAPYLELARWQADSPAGEDLPGACEPRFPQALLGTALRLWERGQKVFLEHIEQLRGELLRRFDVRRLHRRMRTARIGGSVGEENRRVWVAQLPRLWEAPAEELPAVLREIRSAWKFQGRWQAEEGDDLAESVRQFKQALDPLLALNHWDAHLLWREAQLTAAMLCLTRRIYDRYQHRKRQQGVLDFADLLAEAVRLFQRRPEVRRQESEQIELLLVDEFQDTNPLQVELIRLLLDGDLAGGRLFLVGDYKQSIYRFRHAVPEQFLQVRKQIPPEGRLPLSRNFRSRPQVLRFVNALFDGAFAQEYEPLCPHKQELGPKCAVEFLWALPEDGQRRRSVGEARAHEAEWIARRVALLLQQEEPLVYRQGERGGELHPVQPGDVAVLFRAMNDLAVYEAAFQRYDIPYYVVRGRAFFAQQEIYDLAHLLRAVLWPEDEVALLGVLRSPIFGVRDDVLVALGHPLARRFYYHLWPETLPPDQRQALQHARDTLQALQRAKDHLSVSELILEALGRTGYEAALLVDFLGERKLANLHKLLDMARGADASGTVTLADFVYQLEALVAQEPDEPSAALHPEAHGAVKLMSIHQSKGLEFPVVVVADCNRQERPSQTPVHYDPRCGPVVKLLSGRPDRAQSLFDLLAQREQVQRDEESLRLFYVATTRAADYLILSAGFDVGQLRPRSQWLRLLQERFDLESGRYQGDARSEVPPVRVIRQLPEPPQRGSRPAVPDPETLFAQARQTPVETPPQLRRFWEPVPPDGQAVVEFSFSRLDEPLQEILGLEPPAGTGRAAGEFRQDVQAAEVGQLVHAVLARWDFAAGQIAQVRECVQQVAQLHALEHPAAIEQAERILRQFFASELPQRLRQARTLWRELEFLLAWPLQGPPRLQFRGYIDCLFEDPQGRWHLVDFKTSTAEKMSQEELARRYQPQLWLYAQAVRRVLGQEPHGVEVWFLRHGRGVPLRWEESDQQRLVRAIDQAVDRLRRDVAARQP